jgi:hypothetical protein
VSDSDSFIDEVTEEVRRDRLFAFFRRWGWVGVLGVLGVVGGTAYNEWQKARALASAEAFGDAVLAAMASDDAAARLAALDAVPADGPQGVIAALIASGEAKAAGDPERAAAELRAIADSAETPDTWRQLALLKSVLVAGPSMDPAARDAALEGLAAAGAPFRPLAMEQQAVFRRILEEPNLTTALRRRATQMIVALGGEPAAG